MVSNKYEFTETAIKDLDEILNYISNVLLNPISAKSFFDNIDEKISKICDFPESCPILENDYIVKKDIRKTIVDNYIIYYSFEENKHTVFILRIVYGKRNLEEIIKSII